MPVADSSRWRYVVTDMSGRATTGGGPVLNAAQKSFSYHLNAGKTAQITINIDNPRASFILGNDCLLKVYRKTRNTGVWQRLMVGDIIQADEGGQGDSGLITVVATDPWWRFQRRLIGMGTDSLGRGTGYTDGTAAATIDMSNLLMDIVSNMNNNFNTGISAGTIQLCGANSYLGPTFAQNAGDLIQQLCNTLGGPTFEIVPQEPTGTMPSTIIGTLNVWGVYGSARPNALFEYGTGKRNVATYDRILTKDGLCNKAYSPPQGFPSVPAAGDSMIVGQDTTSQNAIGLYEDTIQGDVTSTALRQVLANEYITVRKAARQQITFTPSVDNFLDFGVDYGVGDTITARAYVSGSYRFNGSARVYGIDFTVDDQDAETPALTLIPGG